MGARGAHDGFEASEAVIRAALEAANRGDLEAALTHVDPRLEHVTRDGVLSGPQRLAEEFATQSERWRIDWTLEDLVDAGDGALIAELKVERRNRDTGEVEWRAWPGIVLRVEGGRIVFLEGYVDRRKARDDLGLAATA